MIAPTLSEKLFTVAEYIEFDEKSEIRHEFHEGFLYPIDGTSDIHNEIIQNTFALIRPTFTNRGCKAYHENLKLELSQNSKYVYPDIMLTCDERDKPSPFIKRYPSLVVEVLSKTTATHDKVSKLEWYQMIPSIQYYLLIESRWKSIELYSRTEKKNIWTHQRFLDNIEIIDFPKLDFQLTFDAIYEKLDVPKRFSYITDEAD